MKTILILLAVIFPTAGFASNTICYGWYQINGSAIETITMSEVAKTSQGIKYSASYNGYTYKADWNFQLTSFYISFEFNGKRILTTTARVPTQNHPENFTDLNLPGGPRLSITCEEK